MSEWSKRELPDVTADAQRVFKVIGIYQEYFNHVSPHIQMDWEALTRNPNVLSITCNSPAPFLEIAQRLSTAKKHFSGPESVQGVGSNLKISNPFKAEIIECVIGRNLRDDEVSLLSQAPARGW